MPPPARKRQAANAFSQDDQAKPLRLVIKMGGTKKTNPAPPDTDEGPRATPPTSKNKAKNSKMPDNSETKVPPTKKRDSTADNDEAPRTAPSNSNKKAKNSRTTDKSKAKAPPKKKIKTKKNAQRRGSGGDEDEDNNDDDDEVQVVYAAPPTHGANGRELPSVEDMDANLMRNIMTRRGGAQQEHVSQPKSKRDLVVNLRVREWMATGPEFDHHDHHDDGEEGDEEGEYEEEYQPVTIDLSGSVSDPETLHNSSSQTLSGGRTSSGSGAITPEEAVRDENARTHGAEILMGMQRDEGAAKGDEGEGEREKEELEERARELEKEKMDLAGILAGMARGEGATGSSVSGWDEMGQRHEGMGWEGIY